MSKVTGQLEESRLGADVAEYFAEMAAGLRLEAQSLLRESDLFAILLAKIEAFEQRLRDAHAGPAYREWQGLVRDYRRLLHLKASAANELAQVACCYSSMDEFWKDADAQERGESHRTYWDTYEHGRRRQLEEVFARSYGASAAVLLNSGMSAIAVVIGMLNLRAGCKILTGERCYFETTDYLERYVAKTGVEIIRAPVDRPGELLRAIREHRPDLAIFETVTNATGASAARGFNKWLQSSPQTFFLIDNSVQSHLTRWFEIMGEDPRLLVAESATKYLTGECMAGALYGCEDTVRVAREFARATGQQLQEKAFNYLSEAEVRLAGRKLDRQSRNVAAFIEELRPFSEMFQFIHALDAAVGEAPELKTTIFKYGRGSLIFFALRNSTPGGDDLGQRHRRLLDRWRLIAMDEGIELHIRAGFGWNQTSARAYESGRLNQKDAPCYIRASIGCEPVETIRALARSLGRAARAGDSNGSDVRKV